MACVCVENTLWTVAEDKLKGYDSMFDSHLDSSSTEEVRSLKRLFNINDLSLIVGIFL